MDTLGELIKTHREARGLTTRQLGKLVGTTGSNISQIEKGTVARPSPDIVSRLAEVLSIPELVLLRAMGYLARSSDALGEAVMQTLPYADDWEGHVQKYGSREAAMRHLARLLQQAAIDEANQR